MILIVLRIWLFLLLFISIEARDLLLLAPCDSAVVERSPQSYLWSEKLDGIRAYWDGKDLYSRNGKKLNPPKFFTHNFPPFAVDGELWSKRGDFEYIASVVKSKSKPQEWRKLKFYIFEVPNQKNGLLDRLKILQNYLDLNNALFLAIIPQNTIHSSIDSILKQIEEKGGEGVVIRQKDMPYYTGRNKHSMKCKSYQDRECKIIQYIQGSGKFEDKVGSFLCQDEGKVIKIGSGMDENFRTNPPPLDTIITYKFFGFTKKGNPRFPTFLKIRDRVSLSKDLNEAND